MTNKKPKIAILSIKNSYNYGGVLSSLKVVYQFCQLYFEPKVFFLGFDQEISTSLRGFKFTSSAKPMSYFGMNCMEIGARWAFWEPGHYAFTLPFWQELLKNYDYFFVVSGTCIAAHPLVQLNKKFTMWIGTPYNEDRTERVKQLTGLRSMINSLAYRKMNSIEKSILQKASFVWSISSYAKAKFQAIIGYEKKSLQLCGYPIDCSQAPILDQLQKEKIVLAVGRFSDPRKNLDMLIRVFEKLHQQVPDLKLYIVGLKPATEKIFELSSLPCFDNIIFTGQIPSADLKALYAQAQILLITSYQEGLAIVGLEALLHGTPVIATDCGGTSDYVINDMTGYLVAVNDDDAMVQKAKILLTNRELFQELSYAAQQLITQKFSVSKIHEHFKLGLVSAYPELQEWFAECDQERFAMNVPVQNNAWQDHV